MIESVVSDALLLSPSPMLPIDSAEELSIWSLFFSNQDTYALEPLMRVFELL
jgi:hypothetical protein